MSSILEGRLLLIRDKGVLLMFRPCAIGCYSSSCIWGLLGMTAPRFLDPVWEAIFAIFASLILVCFFYSPGWFCLMSINARLITFLTGWAAVFLLGSFVFNTSFCWPFPVDSSLFWEVLVLVWAIYCLPMIGEGDYFVDVIVPPIFFCLLITRAYFDGELCCVVFCKLFKLSVWAMPRGSWAACLLRPVGNDGLSFELYLKSIWIWLLPCMDWAFDDSRDLSGPSLNSLGWLAEDRAYCDLIWEPSFLLDWTVRP